MPRRQTPPPGSGDPLDIGEIPDYDPSTSSPIGVPSDYETRPYSTMDPRQRDIMAGYGVNTPERGPLTPVSSGQGGDAEWPYYDGDEYFPGQLAPDSIAMLQKQMASLGLLSPNTRFRLGVWDAASQKAYRSLLAYANQQGMNYKQALTHMESVGMGFTVDEFGNIIPVGMEAEQPMPTQTTSPEELKLVFRAAVIDTLGQGWDQEKIDRMVASYNDMEIKQQRAAYEADLSGGNVVGIPSPEAFAVSYAEEQDPAKAQGEDMLGFYNEFIDTVTQGYGSGG